MNGLEELVDVLDKDIWLLKRGKMTSAVKRAVLLQVILLSNPGARCMVEILWEVCCCSRNLHMTTLVLSGAVVSGTVQDIAMKLQRKARCEHASLCGA